MPQVTIDGKTLEFEPGQKLLQLCLDHGTEIPHFCYHPAMSVPANCRQCLVKAGTPMIDRETKEPVLNDDGPPKINYSPKLMPSCALDASTCAQPSTCARRSAKCVSGRTESYLRAQFLRF